MRGSLNDSEWKVSFTRKRQSGQLPAGPVRSQRYLRLGLWREGFPSIFSIRLTSWSRAPKAMT